MSDERLVDERYEILAPLGRGAMGDVYRARDKKLDRVVAIKFMSAAFSRHPSARERFEREARALIALRHPNIVEVWDYSGNANERLYFVMECVIGHNLRDLIQEHGVLPEAVAVAIALELCHALGYAHRQGVIHRDLKPDNVIVEPSGHVMLTDFGLVKAFDDENLLNTEAAGSTAIMGTPGFMAPEQLLGQKLGPPADLFSLGALLMNLLSGEVHFAASSANESYQKISKFVVRSSLAKHRWISEPLLELIASLLNPLPAKRPQDTEATRQGLEPSLRSVGALDPRLLIADFLANPVGFQAILQRREIAYLNDQVKILRYDDHQVATQRVRARLLLLHELAAPKPAAKRRFMNGWLWVVLAISLAALGLLWWSWLSPDALVNGMSWLIEAGHRLRPLP